MGLRRLARQIKTGRRKAAMAAGYAAYVEAEQAAGRVAMGKRAWRLQAARSQSVEAQP